MTYKLTTAREAYSLADAEPLQELGFTFHPCNRERSDYDLLIDQNHVTIELYTLEELQGFVKKYRRVILTENEIMIYNDYVE